MKPVSLNFHERPLTLVKFNHDGDFFMTCAKDGEANLFRTESCERVGSFTCQGAIYAVDITMDSSTIVTAGADGKVIFWNFTGEQSQVLNHAGILKYVEFNGAPGNQDKVVTCNDKFKSAAEGAVPNRIMVWRWQPRLERVLSIDDELPMKATKVKWGAFDETLVSIFEEGTIVMWCATSGKQLRLIQAHTGPVTSVNFSEDKMLMITTSKDMSAKLWATDNYDVIKTYKSDRPLNDGCISPLYTAEKDPKYHVLLGGGQDAKDVTTTAGSSGKFETMIWHLIFEEEIGTIKGHFGPMNCLAWFRDGKGFVTGGEDGYVRVQYLDADYFTSKRFE